MIKNENNFFYEECFPTRKCNIVIYNKTKRIHCERYHILPVFLFYKYGTWWYARHLDISEQNNYESFSHINYYI